MRIRFLITCLMSVSCLIGEDTTQVAAPFFKKLMSYAWVQDGKLIFEPHYIDITLSVLRDDKTQAEDWTLVGEKALSLQREFDLFNQNNSANCLKMINEITSSLKDKNLHGALKISSGFECNDQKIRTIADGLSADSKEIVVSLRLNKKDIDAERWQLVLTGAVKIIREVQPSQELVSQFIQTVF